MSFPATTLPGTQGAGKLPPPPDNATGTTTVASSDTATASMHDLPVELLLRIADGLPDAADFAHFEQIDRRTCAALRNAPGQRALRETAFTARLAGQLSQAQSLADIEPLVTRVIAFLARPVPADPSLDLERPLLDSLRHALAFLNRDRPRDDDVDAAVRIAMTMAAVTRETIPPRRAAAFRSIDCGLYQCWKEVHGLAIRAPDYARALELDAKLRARAPRHWKVDPILIGAHGSMVRHAEK